VNWFVFSPHVISVGLQSRYQTCTNR
jgi:hypothetical protein